MSGFILYDTQAIMEKRRAGSTDCIKHSLDLFFDLAAIFRRLLIILSQKVSWKQRKAKYCKPARGPIQFTAETNYHLYSIKILGGTWTTT